ncbi:MAG: ParB N-terminal domain-containing protein [Oscillospiraceae bacterium]|nr:ParB N-terminal domain-containing protein [Oscillospiraceae bacterium]
MAFDFASVLGDMTALEGQEQIEYIDLDLIDPDPDNFYSLDGLDELAANIETVGLQQPLRVRSGYGDHVTVVSGHRRRAACLLIRDGGSAMFNKGVACIRERGDVSREMQELRLIYANSATRVLSPSEVSKQAERVEALLYALKEQGVEFPGRMRSHVAAAVNASKSRIGRLHAIRANLVPELLELFDSGELNETTAYELQKLPKEAQQAIAESAARKRTFTFRSDPVVTANSYAEQYMTECDCPAKDGAPCGHHIPRFVCTVLSNSGYACFGDCCLDCWQRNNCKQRCPAAAEKVKQEAADREKRKEKDRRDQERAAKKRLKGLQAEAKLFLPLVDAAGLKDADLIPGAYSYGTTAGRIRRFAAGDFSHDGDVWYSRFCRPSMQNDIVRFCKALNCSAEFVLGITDDPTPVPRVDTTPAEIIPTWQTGTPPRLGRYLCKTVGVTGEMEYTMDYDPELADDPTGAWRLYGASLPRGITVLGWWPLPEKEA